MRELFLVAEESTPTSLVLRTGDGESFYLELRSPDSLSAPDMPGSEIPSDSASLTELLTQLASFSKSLPAREEADKAEEMAEKVAGVENAAEETAVTIAPLSVADEAGHTSAETHSGTEAHSSTPEEDSAVLRTLPTPDPKFTAPLSLRPREIQARVRAGASIAELAEEMGVAQTRVEPFAHPVMLERARMAEVAKQAHPQREDGPAKLTLWEVLATAFAAKGHSVADSSWDAYREPAGNWVLKVTWHAGLSENCAEWFLSKPGVSPQTATPRNAIAQDLTDPDFIQPVRSLTSIRREEFSEEHNLPTEASSQPAPVEEHLEGEEFLQNPPIQTPQKRRRKAVTPHWEDVLLGVRTNTKRPRG